MGFIARIRQRWGARREPASAQKKGSSTDVVTVMDPIVPPASFGTPKRVALHSTTAMANASFGQSIVILLEEMASGFSRFTSDISTALGLSSVVPRSAVAEEPQAAPHPAEVLPDPPLTLPRFGNIPTGERMGPHVAGMVDTYFNVRTKKYLTTRKKERSAPRMFEYLGADVIRGKTSARNICTHPNGIMASEAYQRLYKAALKKSEPPARKRTMLFNKSEAHSLGGRADSHDGRVVEPPFIFCINFALPRASQLAPDEYVNVVVYFGRQGVSDNATWEALWAKFLAMTPVQRGARLKLLPVIVNGPAAFQNSIANKPAIIGNKLKCVWFESANHIECIIDVGSSLIANQMWRLMLPQAKNIAMDLAWVIEGTSEDELPEVVLGAAHLSMPDLAAYRSLEDAYVPAQEVPLQQAGGTTPRIFH